MAWAAVAAQAAGAVVEGVEAHKAAGVQRDITKDNFANEKEALRKQQRAEFGSMLSQAGSSGISGSSFQDIFRNQIDEDKGQMAQLRQREQNELTAIKNKKRAGKVKAGLKLLNAGASFAGDKFGGGGGEGFETAKANRQRLGGRTFSSVFGPTG
jgi:hypothetical protein